MEENKLSVLLIEPGKTPKMIKIDDSLEAMQALVRGPIEVFSPFDNDVVIICNEEGKMSGLPLNRAIYADPESIEMSYSEMKNLFCTTERDSKWHTKGYIVFTKDSFNDLRSEFSRTYVVSSNNKAFQPGMGGYSIFGSSLDGADRFVRLDAYMAEEHGGKNGWKIERCYIKKDPPRHNRHCCRKFFSCFSSGWRGKLFKPFAAACRNVRNEISLPGTFFKCER